MVTTMTITEYRDRFLDLQARLRTARFHDDMAAILVIEAELDRILDQYNHSRPPSTQPT